MAGEGGKRQWWPINMGVNVANGNLHIELGAGSCVTCGGTGVSGVYPSPQGNQLTGPIFVYNTLGTDDTDLGPKWMSPFHAHLSVDGSGNVTLIDADGTTRVFAPSVIDTVTTYLANIEDCTLTNDGTDFTLTRCDGDKWTFPMSGANANRLMAITSRDTRAFAIARDSNARITSITDSYSRVTSFYYVTYGSSITRLVEIREPAPGDVGFISTFLDYDSTGRLTSITNPIGETTRFEYDSSNRISKAIDGHGHATIYTYNGSSQVTNIEDPAANSTVLAYTSTTTTVTNRLSTDTVYTIDSSGRCTKTHDALGNEEEFSWNSTTWEMEYELGFKIPVSGTPWSRHKKIFTYGGTAATQHDRTKQEIKKITDTNSTGTLLATVEWTYNAEHDLLTEKNELGFDTTYTYKMVSGASIGRIETISNPESEVIQTNTYGSSANKYRLESSEDGVGNVTNFGYNQNQSNSYGIPDRKTSPDGHITNLLIDVRGRAYQVTDPTGNPVKSVFDDLDRLIQTINPDGTAAESVYDCCHLAAVIDENGHGTHFEYDVLGRRSKATNANGDETLLEYNEEGWRTSVTDARGNPTDYIYDDIARVLETHYPGGWQEINTYFEPGMLKSRKYKLSTTETTVNYEYDDLYYRKKIDFPSGTDTEFVVKANGLREKMKDSSGEKRYYYDKANRLTKVEQGPTNFSIGTSQNYVLEYTWNAASQVTQMKLTIRTKSAQTWDYAHLGDGMLDTVTNPDSEITDHQYLADGRVKKIVLSTGTTREVFYQDTDSSHAYVSGKNRHLRKTLDTKSSAHGSDIICSFAYELDAAGIRLAVTDKDGKYIKFGYDPIYQLKSENKWSAKAPGTRSYQYLFDYDPNGNRTTMHKDGVATGYVYGDNNEMTDAGSLDFTFDNFGNTVTKVDGSVTTTYTFDNDRHMTQVADGTTAHTDSHEYDGDSRRTLSKFANATAANAIRYVHDELTGNVIAEYTFNQFTGGTYTIRSLNTHGIGLIGTNRETIKRYFHFDGLGSTAHLTDANEAVQDSYVYSAFGIQESSSGTSVNPFRFVGRWGYYDDGARGSTYGLLLLGVRYYSPALGRFLVWDAKAESNLYSYVHNASTAFIDPSGMDRVLNACIAAFCAGKQAAEIGSCAGNIAKPLAYIFGQLATWVTDHFPIDPGGAKACIADASSSKPRTVIGRAIRSACSFLSAVTGGGKPNTAVCLRLHPRDENACAACCGRVFSQNDVFKGKCEEFCATIWEGEPR